MSEELSLEEIERAVLSAVEPYTRVSSLHNYGPAGLSRDEKTEIRIGTFIFEDLQNIFAILRSKALSSQPQKGE